MYYRIRQTKSESSLSEVARLQAIEKAVPRNLVEEVLEQYQCKEKRVRKLSMQIVVYLLIGMNLFPRERLALVLGRLLVTFRWLFATEKTTAPNDGAIVYRRKQLGVAPIVALFHRVCRPLATQQTQGEFLFGLRLMAIDGKQINLDDNPVLAAHFGRPGTGRGQAAFPQARLVSLVELGTHAYTVGDRTGL
jgi:Insertion element 4 transposase N-terminal